MKFEDFQIVYQKDVNVNFIDDEGNEELYQIIFTIESEALKKRYAVFVKVADINAEDAEDDQLPVGAAEIIVDEEGKNSLIPIETDEEWEIIEQGLAKFDEEFEQIHDDCENGECDCEECEHHQCYVDEHNNEICECDGECHHHHKEK